MDGEKHIRKAYESILDHDFEQAIASFEHAIAAEPDNADFHYKISVTYARSNRLAKAIEHAAKAAGLAPDNETYQLHWERLSARELVERAEACFDGNEARLYTAVALLQQAIQLDGLAVEAHLLLAMAHAGLQDYGEAIQALNETLRLDPANQPALLLRRELQEKLKHYIHSSNH